MNDSHASYSSSTIYTIQDPTPFIKDSGDDCTSHILSLEGNSLLLSCTSQVSFLPPPLIESLPYMTKKYCHIKDLINQSISLINKALLI